MRLLRTERSMFAVVMKRAWNMRGSELDGGCEGGGGIEFWFILERSLAVEAGGSIEFWRWRGGFFLSFFELGFWRGLAVHADCT